MHACCIPGVRAIPLRAVWPRGAVSRLPVTFHLYSLGSGQEGVKLAAAL